MRRSKFSLSNYHLLTGNFGNLYPINWFEALPGDTVQQRTQVLIRLQPLLAPVMHPIKVRIHHWFVPNRLIWEDFEDFITGGPDGTAEPEPPHFLKTNLDEKSLHTYMGVPPAPYTQNPLYMSALPFRAYNLIWNEHYRDQDLQDEVDILKTSGQDQFTVQDIQRVAWEKDYFTTARPWESKGNEITIPLGDKAPIMGIGRTDQTFNSPANNVFVTGGRSEDWDNDAAGWSNALMQEDSDHPGYPGIYADLAEATGITVNELREALAMQRFQEARAQYGSRYVEYLRYLGVRPSDARLQNPEYLGGGSSIIQFSEVLQTQGSSGADTPLGHMGGHGINAMRSRRYRRFFEEHGIVMTLMSVVPKAIYMEGLPRKFMRKNKEMYFQKELQYMGDQAIFNGELYNQTDLREETFGYQGRYDEYRQGESTISGEFRSVLNYWHLARDFGAMPALNSSFIACNPSDRIFASQDTDQMYVMANNSVQARRMLISSARGRTF